MIERALNMKKVLNYLFFQEKSFKKYYMNKNVWNSIKSLSLFLKPFYDATILVSGSSYSSISTVFPILEHLKQHLQNFTYTRDVTIKKCITKMHNKLLKYESKLNNEISKIAVLLDPRLNEHFFQQTHIRLEAC
jgi:hypothetical protein